MQTWKTWSNRTGSMSSCDIDWVRNNMNSEICRLWIYINYPRSVVVWLKGETFLDNWLKVIHNFWYCDTTCVILSYVVLRLFLVDKSFFNGKINTTLNSFALSYSADNHLTFLIPAPLLPPPNLLVSLVVWTPYIVFVFASRWRKL